MFLYDVSDVTFSQVQIFLCAAKYESFSVAAQRLNYSQSMISKTIAALENNLGLVLFVMKNNKKVLTPAGKFLQSEWEKIYSMMELSIEKAHAIQQGASAGIAMGVIDTLKYNPEIIKAIRIYENCFPKDLFRFEVFPIGDTEKYIEQYSLDIIITAAFDEPLLSSANYQYEVLFPAKVAVFVHKSNPLCQYDEVHLSDLKNEEFIVLSPATNPNYIKKLNRLTRANGFTPNISAQVSNANAFLMNILKGQGIVLADSYTAIAHDDIKMIAVRGEAVDQFEGVIIGYRGQNSNVEEFIKIIRKECEQME